MSKSPVIPSDTIARQRRAASPAHSAWVSANAGSGKTEVLVQRVVRLLLDGAAPSCILCLTFTKAAAAEMTNRVFRRLGQWIPMSDAQLSDAIMALTGARPAPPMLLRARRLFAEAIETPGGLKVQTIHAFCERLLHLFPFDADVPANFRVMEDSERQALCAGVIAELVAEAAQGDEESRRRMAIIADAAGMDALAALAAESLGHEADFQIADQLVASAARYGETVRKLAGIAQEETHESATRDFFAHPFWLHLQPLAALLAGDAKKANSETGKALAAIVEMPGPSRQFQRLEQLLLKKDGDLKAPSTLLTKNFRTAHPDAAADFDAMVGRFTWLQDRLSAIGAIDRSAAVMEFLDAYRRRYDAEKIRRGVLDFDDLIQKARALLHRADIAPWILYKLDYGLSHILVDEAQDTSPEQWDIIKRLSEEFTVGDSSRGSLRTIFAVGDEKQSIYGFQGAAPASFGLTKSELQQRHRAADRNLEDVQLILSFRSTQEVLSAVDRTFAWPDHARGLVFDAGSAAVAHDGLRTSEGGFVELWPQEHGISAETVPDPWSATAADEESMAARAALADRIARYADHLLRHGDSTGKAVRAGDIMILVRHRGGLFESIIQALKFYRIPVAGADRLNLNAHIAVKDLLALGRACILPQDDFNFACLLKSPFCGLDDDDLLRFAPQRSGCLYDAFHAYGESTGAFSAIRSRLQRWQDMAMQHGPFEFYSQILEAQGGRQAMMRRLGPEATDAINEFLSRTHEFETRRYASLTAFLAEFEGRDIEIKRDFAQGGDEVRVMTVHGAKGLEAPIVILPDTVAPPRPRKAQMVSLALPDGKSLPFWCAPGKREPALVQQARQDELREADEEYRRLLYVAMTRAQNGLVICGARQADARPGSWYHMVSTALRAEPPPGERGPRGKLHQVDGFDGAPVERWLVERPAQAVATADKAEAGTAAGEDEPSEPLPDWLLRPVAALPERRTPIAPSAALSGADDGPVNGKRQAARARGQFIHALLRRWPSAGSLYGPANARTLATALGFAGDAEEALAAVETLLGEPLMAPLFGPEARAEVAISGVVADANGERRPVSGVVDRLWVGEEAVWIADFKTGAQPPPQAGATPWSIVAQLALYRAVLTRIFPGKPVRCLVVWTTGPVIHELPAGQLDAALARVTLP